jgi:hypothetical protein
MLSLIKLIEIRVQALDLLCLEPATVGDGAILPLDKKLLVAAPPGGHKLVIKNGLNFITRLNSGRGWKRWRSG